MYLELLVKASVSHSASVAHPGFVNIIENLSPDEAVLLQTVQHQLDGIPFIEVRFQKKGEQKWITFHPMILQEKYYGALKYPDNLPAYVSNLVGLGIFEVQNNVSLDLNEIYSELEEIGKRLYPSFAEIDGTRKLTSNRGRIMITGFARLFLSACFSNQKN